MALSSAALATLNSVFAKNFYGKNGLVDLLAYIALGFAISLVVTVGSAVRGNLVISIIACYFLAIHPISLISDLGFSTAVAYGVKAIEILLYTWLLLRLVSLGLAQMDSR